MSDTPPAAKPAAAPPRAKGKVPEVKIYRHSMLLYWWPVWLAGFIAGAITHFEGVWRDIGGGKQELFHPDPAVGILYLLVVMLVIIFTNMTLRGIYSFTLAITIVLVAVIFAWVGWWEDIFKFLPDLSIYMNGAFYFVFSGTLFVTWFLVVFFFDRLKYWRVVPGQISEEFVFGAGKHAYDARGMAFAQESEDFFRHKLLGFGSADLRLTTSGAKGMTFDIPNVLFAGRKAKRIRQLVAVAPDQLRH